MYLWKKRGKGVECICELTIQDVQRLRVAHEIERGNRVAWHNNLAFQMLGVCTLKHTEEGYPIADVEVAMNEDVSNSIHLSIVFSSLKGYYCIFKIYI